MDVETLNQIANSQTAYLIMFMALLAFVVKTSYERENKMREQLDKTVPILHQILNRLDLIEDEIKNK